MNKSLSRHPVITGTVLLTCAGFLTKILGFVYRIFLSRTIGAEGLGIYHMVFPVYGICLSMCASAIQTAISQSVAARKAGSGRILCAGIMLSMTIACTLSYLLYHHTGWVSLHILLEPRCADLLPLVALSIPFAAFHSCINGYYYGLKKTVVPAASQFIEQFSRILLVLMIYRFDMIHGKAVSVQLAAAGLFLGEIISAAFTALAVYLSAFSHRDQTSSSISDHISNTITNSPTAAHSYVHISIMLFTLSLPLMLNRLVLTLLQSLEAVMIPNQLLAHGLNDSQAYSTYGTLTGMAFPMILFPSAITNSLSVLLLPTVSQAQSSGQQAKISQTIQMSITFCLSLGIYCAGIFLFWGNELGNCIFHHPEAGTFLTTLSWLCPFLYLSTTSASILHGLGKTPTTFWHNVLVMIIRLGFIFFGIPAFGISAFLWGLLASEICLVLLHLTALHCLVPYRWNIYSYVIIPVGFLLISIGIGLAAHFAFSQLTFAKKIPPIICLGGKIICSTCCYLFFSIQHYRKNWSSIT